GVREVINGWDGNALLAAHDKFVAPTGQFVNFVAKNRLAIATGSMPKDSMKHWIMVIDRHVASYAHEYGYAGIATGKEYDRRCEAQFEKEMQEYEQSPLVTAERELHVELDALKTLIAELAAKKRDISSAARRVVKEKKEAQRRAEEQAVREALLSGVVE